MANVIPFFLGLYYIVVIAVVVFLLIMISRGVKAVEKIADTYSKKNSSV